jgi:predicted transcriptional regulator
MDKPAPGYGGKTFKEVYGETALIASARKSLGIEAEMSQREHLEFISSLQPDVESGNVKAVREKYEEYKKRDLERSGDPSYMSKESADLLKLLDKTGHNYRQIQKREAEKRERELQAQLQLAEKNALKAAQLAEKELQAKTQILKERSWTYEGVNLLKQSNDMNIDTFMKQTGMNWNKFNDYYDQLNQLGLISFEDHVKIAQNQTIPRGQNPALKMMKQVNNSAMSTVGKLVDGMFYKTDVPPQEIPKELAQAVDLFNKIGYAEYQATTDADDDTVSAIEAISRAQAEGGAYTDVIKNRAAEQMKKQQDKTYDSRKTLEINKMVKAGLFTGYDFPMDGRAQTAIAQETVAIMRNNSWDSKKAGQQAYDNFWKKNDSVFGATVPKSTFSPSNGFPEGSLEFVQKFIKSEVEQGQVQGLQGFFNQNSQTFSIVDIGTLEVKKSWTVDELRKIAQEEHGIDLMQRQYDKYGLTEQVKKDMEEKGYELDSFKKVKPKGKSRREFKAWSEKPSVLHDHEVDLSSNTGTGD